MYFNSIYRSGEHPGYLCSHARDTNNRGVDFGCVRISPKYTVQSESPGCMPGIKSRRANETNFKYEVCVGVHILVNVRARVRVCVRAYVRTCVRVGGAVSVGVCLRVRACAHALACALKH